MGEFDTSDEEEDFENIAPVEPFRIDWLNIPNLGLCQSLALSSLPGCRFKENRRNIVQDVEAIADHGITDVFILMKSSEFRKYRVPGILDEYDKRGILVHHHPVEDGGLPPDEELMKMIQSLESLVSDPSHRVLIHCYGGLGRTGVFAACFLLSLDKSLLPETAISYIRNSRGARAIQTVRQWNFVQDYRNFEKNYLKSQEEYEDRSRSVSR